MDGAINKKGNCDSAAPKMGCRHVGNLRCARHPLFEQQEDCLRLLYFFLLSRNFVIVVLFWFLIEFSSSNFQQIDTKHKIEGIFSGNRGRGG
jgi:hypothetical protein